MQAQLVERRCEAAAICGRESIVRAEALEQSDGDLTQAITVVARGAGNGIDDELQSSLDISVVERGHDLWQLARRPKLVDECVGPRGREKRLEEGVDGGARSYPCKFRNHVAVTKGFHGRDPADRELLGEPGIGIDVNLDEE